MDNYIDNILAQLREGQKIEDIASALTNSINEANKQYEAELQAKRAEEEKQALQATNRNNKIKCADEALDAIDKLMACYDLSVDEGVSGEDLVNILDELLPVIQEYEKLMGKIHSLRKEVTMSAPTRDPIEDFLNKYIRN